jgi:hypothetical protein
MENSDNLQATTQTCDNLFANTIIKKAQNIQNQVGNTNFLDKKISRKNFTQKCKILGKNTNFGASFRKNSEVFEKNANFGKNSHVVAKSKVRLSKRKTTVNNFLNLNNNVIISQAEHGNFTNALNSKLRKSDGLSQLAKNLSNDYSGRLEVFTGLCKIREDNEKFLKLLFNQKNSIEEAQKEILSFLQNSRTSFPSSATFYWVDFLKTLQLFETLTNKLKIICFSSNNLYNCNSNSNSNNSNVSNNFCNSNSINGIPVVTNSVRSSNVILRCNRTSSGQLIYYLDKINEL